MPFQNLKAVFFFVLKPCLEQVVLLGNTTLRRSSSSTSRQTRMANINEETLERESRQITDDEICI